MTEFNSPSPLSVSVRPATAGDVDLIVALIAPFVSSRQLLPRTRDEVARLTETGFAAETIPAVSTTKATADVVGFAAVEIYSNKLAEIQCLAVSADYHGQGLGRQLVEQCIALARSRNVRELMAISASEKFLQQCGFDFSLPDQKKALFLQLS